MYNNSDKLYNLVLRFYTWWKQEADKYAYFEIF